MSWLDGGAPRASTTQYGAVLPCIECGATPGAEAIFRGQRVELIVRVPEIARGPFCRNCGIATFRRLQAWTIARGWKGLFAPLTPWILGRNLVVRRRITALPEAYDSPPVRPRLRAGQPVWRRKQIFGLLQPIVAIAVVLGLVWAFRPLPVRPTPGGLWQVGACVQVDGQDVMLVDCHGGHNGEIIAVVDHSSECPTETTWAVRPPGPTVLTDCVRVA